MKLTEQQEKAAYAAGSVAVTAGAGTGKTAMLAQRFLYHVQKQNLRPIEIVAVTFTEKAAAELRQRIRSALTEHLEDEDLIAEVDAAQISTIHALAARVCREFYSIVGISPDFRILLETESAIWLADKFDAAMARIDEDIIVELGYSWLKSAIGQLLLDPHLAAKAFGHDTTRWKNTVDEHRQRSLDWLVSCDAWADATIACGSLSGKDGDKLEGARCDAINAMAEIERGENISEALRMLRKLPAHLGQKGSWAAGEIDRMRAALKALKRAASDDGPAWAADLEFVAEDEIAATKVKLLHKAFLVVHDHLLEQKRRDNVLDFIDLELYAAEILRRDHSRQHYAKRWLAFLVDEFQDINPLQGEIIAVLSQGATLTVVGDEKQSIYGFRRADIEVFQGFRKAIAASGGDVIQLSETFRAHESLTVAVNNTFEPILGKLHQPLDANRKVVPNDGAPLVLAVVTSEAKVSPEAARVVESRYIADEIRRMFDAGINVFDKGSKGLRRIEYSDIAVLSRTWAAIDVYIDALSAEGIPAVNAGGGNLLQTRESKDAIAILTFLADPADNISLSAVLRSPFFAVSDRALFELAKGKGKDETWWHLIQKAGGAVGHARDVLAGLLEIKNLVSTEDLLRESDRLTGYTATVANLPQGDRREADWLGMLSLIRELSRNGLPDLLGTVRQLKALADGRNSIPRPPLDAGNAITLTSIHNAKGLEWPVVFVPDLSGQTGGWGDKLLIDSDLGIAFKTDDEANTKTEPATYRLIKRKLDDLGREEEKRLLYVAITRARDGVILSSGLPEKKGTAIEFLMPGIEAAGIPKTEIPFSDDLALPPMPLEPSRFAEPTFQVVEPVRSGLTSVAATGLTDFAVCPRKFKYIYVEGHPGLGEGEARATMIGSLTHKALQFDLMSFEDLSRIANGASAECIEEALELAQRFRTNPVFKDFQNADLERERTFLFKYGKMRITGSADLVGVDFVLDYKTGVESDAHNYRLQLWAYAKALEKRRALIANLRKRELYEYSEAELTETEKLAGKIINNIVAGVFDADPSPPKCSRCVYSAICESSATKKSNQIVRAVGEQLELF